MTYFNKLEEISKILKKLESTAYSNTFVQSFNDFINLKNKSEKYKIERKKEIKKHDMNQNYLKRFY